MYYIQIFVLIPPKQSVNVSSLTLIQWLSYVLPCTCERFQGGCLFYYYFKNTRWNELTFVSDKFWFSCSVEFETPAIAHWQRKVWQVVFRSFFFSVTRCFSYCKPDLDPVYLQITAGLPLLVNHLSAANVPRAVPAIWRSYGNDTPLIDKVVPATQS